MEPTSEQRQAATAQGSVAVTAGAGTGKTRMLAWRYMHHIEGDGLSPLQIVAVTFTDKAADELRSRIRKTIAESTLSAEVLAEVEASQISTIHALAARICRDFYHVAEIPPDFVILDEAESPMWVAAQFERSLGAVDPSIVEQLGYTWLSNVLRQLLADPLRAENALSRDSAAWREAVELAVMQSCAELKATSAWMDGWAILPRYSGKPGDKLEDARLEALGAMDSIVSGSNIPEAADILAGLKASGGVAGNWASAEERETIRMALAGLKEAAKERKSILKLSYGDLDNELARQLDLIRIAFSQAENFIRRSKIEHRNLDFADLEIYALKALRHPSVVAHYAQRWRAFIVDEFQDTNPVQAEILRLLTSSTIRTIVGDEKQSIYGFRGADVNVFADFRRLITEDGGKVVKLTKTYRSHQPITSLMNRVFSPVLGVLRQDLEAHRAESKAGIREPFITINIVEKVSGTYKHQQQVVEARFIADQIAELTTSGEIQYRDIAVLSRAWAPLDIYADVLAAAGIPAVHAGGGSLLTTREALDARAVVDFLAFPHDDIPLATILRSPFFAVSDKNLYYFVETLREERGSSWWEGLAKTEMPELQYAHSVLSRVREAACHVSPSEAIKYLDSLTGYGAVIANLPHGRRREADWKGILAFLRGQERSGRPDGFSLSRFLKQLTDAEVDIPRPPLNPGDAVSLMTIHKAKGLEWPIVFIPDLARDVKTNSLEYLIIDPELGVGFKLDTGQPDRVEPATYTLLKDRRNRRDREESKRVLYVAMTRAEDKIVITATKEKGYALDLLRPGLGAAGIVDEPIPYQDDLAIPPAPQSPAPFAGPEIILTDSIPMGLSSIPVTGLTTFAKCGRQFEFRHVMGHPGLGEGPAGASSIGTLAHYALEHDIDDSARLQADHKDAPDGQVVEALELAQAFRSDEAFAELRGVATAREVSCRLEHGQLVLYGTADVVGHDFVVDYKTDSQMHPDEHRFQLWAYARALGKSEALIAYLRHRVLHRFDEAELNRLDGEAEQVIDSIVNGRYTSSPSKATCSFCSYQALCGDRYVEEAISNG